MIRRCYSVSRSSIDENNERSDYNTVDGRRLRNTNAPSTVADYEILVHPPSNIRHCSGLGSPLPLVTSPSIALIYSSRKASHIIIYTQAKPHVYIFSRTASRIYISAE